MAGKKPVNPHLRPLESMLSSVYGWAINPTLRAAVQDVVTRKARRLVLDEVTYCRMAAKSPGELHSVAEEIALGETCFFREPEQFRALHSHVLPRLIDRRRNDRKVRVWSAGCSSGEEPYSLALLLEDLIAEPDGWRVEILAMDLRSRALLEASQGRYAPVQLRNIPLHLRERYFSGSHLPDGPPVELDRRVRRHVKFRHANLFDRQVWQHLPGQFDLVVCSNVLMHLTHSAMVQTMARIEQALAPNGYLMVGAAEATLTHNPKLKPDRTLPAGFFVKGG